MITIAEIVVADDPAAWAAAGFSVHDGMVCIGRVQVRLSGMNDGQRGVVSWHLRDAIVPGDGAIDGLVTEASEATECEPAAHANGANLIDHIVIATPHYARTVSALGAAGFDLRRERDSGSAHAPRRQGFCRAGEVIVEIVGPAGGAPSADNAEPARFFGLAFVVDDLDATKAFCGDLLSPPKPAVQPGRRIATLHHRDAGLTTAIAFMTP
ncbi:MAG: hypothetical protein JWL83_2990 [Actinomycetia bacterium]|nr:hypothetical protein [Actinomycetes bacterium]